MTTFLLSLKRLIFSKGFVLSLLTLPVILIFTATGFNFSENKSIAKAGIFFENPDDISYFENLLASDNFVAVNSYEELETSVSNGTFDCGFKITEDFEKLLENVKLDESIEVIITERSEMAPFFTQEITAHTSDISVPYISAKILDTSGETNLSYGEILSETKEKYEISLLEESVIFEYREISGKPLENTDSLYPSVVKGLVAIILFIFSLVSAECISNETTNSISQRINIRKTIFNIYIPFGISFTLCILLSSGIGIFISDMIMPVGIDIAEFILHIFIYSLMLMGITFIISSFVSNMNVINMLIAPIATVSAIICPIFTDIRNINILFKIISFICPPFYLFGYKENIVLYPIISLSTLILGCVTMFLHKKRV